jgi:hypothetical protein
VVTLIFLTLLPLSARFWPHETVLWLLILVILAFTTLRGLAACTWMPWITALVPRSLRGFYLSRDRMFIGVASVAALAISGAFLFDHGNMLAFAVVFGLSFVSGATSLYFLNRVPDPERPLQSETPLAQLRWRDLLRDEAFVRLLIFAAAVQLCVLSTATFITVFVREEVALPDGAILWITAGGALIGIFGLRLLRSHIDGLGSRPFLGMVLLWWTLAGLVWFALAAGLLPGSWLIAPLLMMAAGFFGSIYELSLTRLLMNTVGDRPGSTQYFALQSVITSLLAGLAPILWGWMLDHLARIQLVVGGLSLNNYALFFGIQWLLLAVVFATRMQVQEGSATATLTLLHRALLLGPGQHLTHRTQPRSRA